MCAVALAPPRLSQTIRPERGDRAAARELERQLLIRYHEFGDLAAREELVERFLPLARDLALRYTYTDEPYDDLLQVASLGLIKAIDRFEPGPRHEVHELRRAHDPRRAEAPLPRQGLVAARAARPPGAHARGQPRDRDPLQGARPLAQGPRGGRPPRLLARAGARGAGGCRAATRRRHSTRRPPATTASPPRSWTCSAARTRPTSSSRTATRSPAPGTRSPRWSAQVLELRFMHDLTQREIGERIGYSQMHVSRLLRRALTRLETAASAA